MSGSTTALSPLADWLWKCLNWRLRLVEEWCELAFENEIRLSAPERALLLDRLSTLDYLAMVEGGFNSMHALGMVRGLLQLPYDDEALVREWAQGTTRTRQGFLHTALILRPEEARLQLRKRWPEELVRNRRAFLETFEPHARHGDEPFLLMAMEEPRHGFRYVAMQALGRLSTPAVVESAFALATEFVSADPELKVSVPDLHDPRFAQFGVGIDSAIGEATDRFRLLEKLIALIPPSRWERIGLTPEKAGRWSFSPAVEAFQEGLEDAIRHYRDACWARGILEAGTRWPGSLIRALEPAERERYLLETALKAPLDEGSFNNNFIPWTRWSLEFSRRLLQAPVPVHEEWLDEQLSDFAQPAWWLHPEVELPDRELSLPSRDTYETWREILDFRRGMHNAFKEAHA